jgi:hypothetical protein
VDKPVKPEESLLAVKVPSRAVTSLEEPGEDLPAVDEQVDPKESQRRACQWCYSGW